MYRVISVSADKQRCQIVEMIKNKSVTRHLVRISKDSWSFKEFGPWRMSNEGYPTRQLIRQGTIDHNRLFKSG